MKVWVKRDEGKGGGASQPYDSLRKGQVFVVGRGLSKSFPVSSQDMLNSAKTRRVLAVMIEGAITLLWIPITKRTTKIILARVKKG